MDLSLIQQNQQKHSLFKEKRTVNINFNHYLPWNLFKDPAKFNIDAVNPAREIQNFQAQEAATAEAAVQRPLQGIISSIKNAALSIIRAPINAIQKTIDLGSNAVAQITQGVGNSVGEILENTAKVPISIASNSLAAVGNGLHKAFALGRTAFSAGNVIGAYASRGALRATSVQAKLLQDKTENLGILARINGMTKAFNDRITGVTVPGYRALNPAAAAA